MKVGYFLGGVAVGVGLFYVLNKRLPWPLSKLTGTFGADEGALPADALRNALGVHVRQIRRYAFASSQDISPIVGITHASYALVLLDTLQEIVGTEAIKQAGYDPSKLRRFITDLQDKHADKLKACDAHLQQILALEKAEGNGKVTRGFVVAGAPLGA